MKRTFWLVLCGLLLFALAGFVGVQRAQADPKFKKQFDDKYVKENPSTPEEKSLAEAVKVAKCTVCHDPETKKIRNVYGNELGKLIKKTDRNDTPKIKAALETVAGLPSDPAKPGSPTFGDLLKQGKLPAGK